MCSIYLQGGSIIIISHQRRMEEPEAAVESSRLTLTCILSYTKSLSLCAFFKNIFPLFLCHTPRSCSAVIDLAACTLHLPTCKYNEHNYCLIFHMDCSSNCSQTSYSRHAMIANHPSQNHFNEITHFLHIKATFLMLDTFKLAVCVSILCKIGLCNGTLQHILVIQVAEHIAQRTYKSYV